MMENPVAGGSQSLVGFENIPDPAMRCHRDRREGSGKSWGSIASQILNARQKLKMKK